MLELEKMKENVNSKVKDNEKKTTHVQSSKTINIQRNDADDSDDSDDDISDGNEYLDWRSKKAYK